MATTPRRRCLECGAPLEGGVQQKFCNDAHRKRYARRQDRRARTNDRAQHPELAPGEPDNARAAAGMFATSDVSELVGKRRDEIIRQTFIEELRPIVREAIDEDAVRAIKGMVGLAPTAVLVLQQDLLSEDPVTRSKAAALVIKYTLGNPNVTPPREGSGQGITIINALPDAATVPASEFQGRLDEVIEGTAVDDVDGLGPWPGVPDPELRICDGCNLPRPRGEFPADGPRCATCLAERKAAVLEAFAIDSSDALPEPGAAGDVQREGPPGQPPVHQAGQELQPVDLRTTGLDQTRYAHQTAPPSGGRQGWAEAVRGAAFAGPPDPNRWSPGKG